MMLSLTTPSETAWLRPNSLDHRQHGQQMDAEFRSQASCHGAIVIDCAQLQTLNSTGTGRMVNWLRDAAAQNVRVSVANVTPALRALFDLTSLSSVLPAMPATALSTSTGRAAQHDHLHSADRRGHRARAADRATRRLRRTRAAPLDA